jgi:aminotransferase
MTVAEQRTKPAKPSVRSQSLGVSGIRKIFEKAQSMPDVIRLEFGEPDFQTPENIKEAARRAITNGRTKYTPGAGMPELRKAIADKLQSENNIHYEPNEVVVAAGATSALNLSVLGSIDQGEEILIPNPGWATYAYAVGIVGGVPVEYKLDRKRDYAFDKDYVSSLVTDKTRAILINSPNNPTGSIFSEKDLHAVADLSLERGLTVISDEVYEKFRYDYAPSEVSPCIGALPDMKDRTIVVNSFSKTYAMTGWRVGYVASSASLADAMAKVNTAANSCVSQISQIAALEALTGPQDSVKEMLSVYKERRSIIVKRLNEINGFDCPLPKGAFYAFPNITGTRLNSFDLSMKILETAHVATVPGSSFGSEGEGYLRLSYANSKQNIEAALDRISKLL